MFNHSKKPPLSPCSASSHPIHRDVRKFAASKARIRSASAGRSPNTDLRTRYWTFLFENLHRAVDEIYQTCETDESIVECKEAIMMLENYTKEFHALIEWFNLNKNYENTPPPNRPTSLSWEVRKSSPGKAMLWSMFFDKAASPAGLLHAKRGLFVSTAVQTASVASGGKLPSDKTELLESVESLLSAGTTDLCFFNSKPSLKIQISSFQEEAAPTDKPKPSVANPISSADTAAKPETPITPNLQPIQSLRSLCESAIHGYKPSSSDLTQEPAAESTHSDPTAIVKGVTSQDTVGALPEVGRDSQGAQSERPSLTEVHRPTETQSDVAVKPVDKAVELMDSKPNELKNGPQTQKSLKASGSQVGLAKPKSSLREQGINKFARRAAVPVAKPRYSLPSRIREEPRPSADAQKQRRDPSYPTVPKISATARRQVPSGTAKKSEVPPARSELSRGSTLSLCSNQSWADKVRGTVAKSQSALDLKACPDLPAQIPLSRSSETSFLRPDDDSEGWETVRGRTRSRNSPGKTNGGTLSTAKQITASEKLGQVKHTTKVRTSHNACFVKREVRPSVFTPPVNEGTCKRLVKTSNVSNRRETLSKVTNKVSLSSALSPKKVLIEGSNHLNQKNAAASKKKVDQLNKANQDKKVLKEKPLVTIMDFIENTQGTDGAKNELPARRSGKLSCEKKLDPSSDAEDDVKENKMLKADDAEELTSIRCEDEDEDKLHSNENSEELPLGSSDELEALLSNSESLSGSQTGDWFEQIEEAQEKVHELGLSWGDQMDHLDLELRTPGRALHMHEKLSSPFRKRSLSENLRRQEERQLKAQEQRERLLEEKAQKFKGIQKKMEEMKAWKEEQQMRRRLTMEKKLQRAEEKRLEQLQMIVRKAHDEEEKVNEIAFINTLEAQNKRHDILSKEKDHEARLLDIQEERQRKLEEKAAKEAAAEERRRALEAERQARLQEMQEKRKLRDLKVEQQLQEKEKERLELANQKARDRELRLSALTAAQQATAEELQKKIHLKQTKSARRHEENMEQIRQKAFELSVRRCSSNNDDAPCLSPYETKKMCTLCSVIIDSEVYLLSHLRGKQHQEAIRTHHQGEPPSPEELESYNLKHIVDAILTDKVDPEVALNRERQKSLKKRCKKLRQRMNSRASEFGATSHPLPKELPPDWENKQKLSRAIKLCKLGELAVDRPLGELQRHFSRDPTVHDQLGFLHLGGVAALAGMLGNSAYPLRTQSRACEVLLLACQNCPESCLSLLCTNQLGPLLDCLASHLSELVPEESAVEPLVCNLLEMLSKVLQCLPSGEASIYLQDLLSYTVCIGIVDKMADYFQSVQRPLDGLPQVAKMVSCCLGFLTIVIKVAIATRKQNGSGTEDPTQLLATCRATELIRIVPLLYGMLLHGGAPCREGQPPCLPPPTLDVTQKALCLLTHLAYLDLHLAQGVLGRDGVSLQLRHVSSYLLWYCSQRAERGLLHELVLLLGYFSVLCPDNQGMVHCGQSPTVLQQLCSLPFQYFCDPALTDILFPTLVACCYPNPRHRQVLHGEMSTELLANYIESCLLDVHHSAIVGKARGAKPDGQRWDLGSRFPKSAWTEAKKFFSITT